MTETRTDRGRLIAELYELEQAIHRIAFRRAESRRPKRRGAALRALAAHSSTALDELRPIAKRRQVTLGSPTAIWRDTLLCLRDGILDHVAGGRFVIEGETHAEEEVAHLRDQVADAVGLVAVLETAADAAGDALLASWCRRWLHARTELATELVPEALDLGGHPANDHEHEHAQQAHRPSGIVPAARAALQDSDEDEDTETVSSKRTG